VTALLEFLDLAVIAHNWFLLTRLKLYSSKPLKDSSKLINPSAYQFSGILLSGLPGRSGILLLLLTYSGGCPAALTQGCFTFRHNQILKCLPTEISKLFTGSSSVLLYADLPGPCASDCPQATIPVSLFVTPYRPDLVICNRSSNCVAMMELTCPLDSVEHLQFARECKQGKQEYLMVQSELHCLGVDCSYSTGEVSVSGHYLTSSL